MQSTNKGSSNNEEKPTDNQESMTKAIARMKSAILKHDDKRITKLIENGFPIDVPLETMSWVTALMLCAAEGNETSLQVILNAGADINARDKIGR